MGCFSNLANTIVSHFSLERTLTEDNVNRAYSMAERAISQFPGGDSRRPTLLNNLASVLQYRFRRSNSQHDLDTAIASVQEGLASIGPNASQQSQLLRELEIQLYRISFLTRRLRYFGRGGSEGRKRRETSRHDTLLQRLSYGTRAQIWEVW